MLMRSNTWWCNLRIHLSDIVPRRSGQDPVTWFTKQTGYCLQSRTYRDEIWANHLPIAMELDRYLNRNIKAIYGFIIKFHVFETSRDLTTWRLSAWRVRALDMSTATLSRVIRIPKRWNQHALPPWYQGSWGQHGAHLGTTGPRWAQCWPHEHCYLGIRLCCKLASFALVRRWGVNL